MSEVKNVTLDCVVEKKTFPKKETGELVEYLDLKLIVGDGLVKVVVPSEYRKLFNFLIKPYID